MDNDYKIIPVLWPLAIEVEVDIVIPSFAIGSGRPDGIDASGGSLSRAELEGVQLRVTCTTVTLLRLVLLWRSSMYGQSMNLPTECIQH